ncbi:Serine protease 48, partial [Bulinus truncatus]
MSIWTLLSFFTLTILTQTTSVEGQAFLNNNPQKQTAEQCQGQCQALYNFYKRIIMLTSMLDRYLESCLQLCPAPAPTTTTPRTVTTPSSPTTRVTGTSILMTTLFNQRAGTFQDCGLSGNRNRIVGGTRAEECEFPWVAEVLSPCSNCGGTIVDSRHIVTAAHCLSTVSLLSNTGCRVTASDLTVKVGSSSLAKTTAYKVSNITIDSRYNYVTKDNDVAVLRLAQDLTFSQCVRPVCLPSTSDDPAKSEECLTAGWGKTDEKSNEIVHINDLMKVKVPIVDEATCRNSYRANSNTIKINENKLCAGNLTHGGKDSCT